MIKEENKALLKDAFLSVFHDDFVPEQSISGFGAYAKAMGQVAYKIAQIDNSFPEDDGKTFWKYIDNSILSYYKIAKEQLLEARELFITEYNKGLEEAKNEKRDDS